MASAAAEDIRYGEHLPDIRLQHCIYYYWELKTTQALGKAFNYRIVADGCIDVFFEINNPAASFVMGFSDTYTDFSLQHNFHYVGIRFLPAMFTLMFGIKASELSNRYESLSDVFPQTSRFIAANFTPMLESEQIKALLDLHFLQHIADRSFELDSRVHEAIHIILQKAGALHVEKDLDTGISPRQLRRLFEFYIGDTPKAFSKIVRFQSLLQGHPSAQLLREQKLFFDAGYYDQAHFIKEFKSLYGDTPAHALRK